MDQNGSSYKSIKERHAFWECHKRIIERIQQGRTNKILDAKVDINLAPMDHLICLKSKYGRLTLET